MSEEFNQTLERIGFGRYHYWIFIVGGSVTSRQGWFSNLAALNISAVFFASAGDEWNLSYTVRGVLAAIYMLGMILGAGVSGYLADKKGRMYPFRRSILIHIASLAFLIASVNAYMASIALFCLGFAAAAEITVAGTVFQEFCPPSKQYILTLLATMWCLGAAITALVVSVLIESDLPIELWRSTCFYGIIIGVVFFVFRIKVPETPRYLIHMGREREAHEVLQMISNLNKKDMLIPVDNLSLQTNVNESDETSNEEKTNTNLFFQIWKPEYLKETVVFGIAFFLGDFAFVFLSFFMPELLKEAGVSGAMVYLTIAIQQAAGIPGIIVGSFLVETRLGRKYSIVYPMIICGIVNLAFIFARSYWELLLFTSLSTLTNYLAWSVLYTIVPESYKTNVRNTGVGWANAMAKLGGLVGPLAGGIILDIPNGFYISIVLTCSMVAGVGALGLLMKETRGKSL